MNIIRHLEQGYDDFPENLTQDNLSSWKKELISKLKDFEKKYVKHAKSTNPALAEIHATAMKPVVELMDSAVNLDNFNIIAAKKPDKFPDFRRKALEAKFVENLTAVCKIIKGFANTEGKTLDEDYDIQHTLDLLAIDGWDQSPPLKFYLDPLLQAYTVLVKELRRMHEAGPLRCSYYVERNLEMTKGIFELVRQFNITKILMGDELKRDQFKFIYMVHDKVYKSALKDLYLNPDARSN